MSITENTGTTTTTTADAEFVAVELAAAFEALDTVNTFLFRAKHSRVSGTHDVTVDLDQDQVDTAQDVADMAQDVLDLITYWAPASDDDA